MLYWSSSQPPRPTDAGIQYRRTPTWSLPLNMVSDILASLHNASRWESLCSFTTTDNHLFHHRQIYKIYSTYFNPAISMPSILTLLALPLLSLAAPAIRSTICSWETGPICSCPSGTNYQSSTSYAIIGANVLDVRVVAGSCEPCPEHVVKHR